MLKTFFIVVGATFCFGCGSNPEIVDENVKEVVVEQTKPAMTAEEIADCPCGRADWSKEPPGFADKSPKSDHK